MGLVVLRKIAHLVTVLFIVTLAITFMSGKLPGEPAYAIYGETATPEQVTAVNDQLQLDEPFATRYISWVTKALHGDFGESLRTGENVAHAIRDRFAVTFEVMLVAELIAIIIAVPLALYGAIRRNTIFDRLTSALSFGFISVPPFVVGIMLILVFAVSLGWLPTSGYQPISDGLLPNLASVLLPSLSLALVPLGMYQRILRSDAVVTLRQDYILGAKAKGMSTPNILLRQTLRPSSLGFVTVLGVNMATLIGGSVVIETIFALPGLGQLMVSSVQFRDIVVIQALVTMIAVVYVLINLFIDSMYRILDPRIRT